MKKPEIRSTLATDIIAETELGLKKKRGKNSYINNEKLLEEIVVYLGELKKFKDGKLDLRPKVSEYIGSAILKIAERLASRPNFSGYSYKEEMIGDGIENCLMYLGNFNPDISKNPFAYLTQIIWFAFVRRIQREKKQQYTKMKLFENSDTSGSFKDHIVKKHNISTENAYAEYLKLSDYDLAYFESKKKAVKKKKIKKKLKKKAKKPNLGDILGE